MPSGNLIKLSKHGVAVLLVKLRRLEAEAFQFRMRHHISISGRHSHTIEGQITFHVSFDELCRTLRSF